jgi:hypothetical protein
MPSPTQHNPTQLTNLYCYTYHSQPARRGSRHVDALPCVPEPIPTTRTEWGGPQTLALKLKRTASHSLPHVWHSHLPRKQVKAHAEHLHFACFHGIILVLCGATYLTLELIASALYALSSPSTRVYQRPSTVYLRTAFSHWTLLPDPSERHRRKTAIQKEEARKPNTRKQRAPAGDWNPRMYKMSKKDGALAREGSCSVHSAPASEEGGVLGRLANYAILSWWRRSAGRGYYR